MLGVVGVSNGRGINQTGVAPHEFGKRFVGVAGDELCQQVVVRRIGHLTVICATAGKGDKKLRDYEKSAIYFFFVTTSISIASRPGTSSRPSWSNKACF